MYETMQVDGMRWVLTVPSRLFEDNPARWMTKHLRILRLMARRVR